MKKKGFTLIELLVVIAIIALLLSIVMPALRKAKEASRCIVCRSNLRQMSLAFNTYSVENDGKMFSIGYGTSDDLNEYWFREISPYLGDEYFRDNPVTDMQNGGVMKVGMCPDVTVQTDRENGYADKTWRFDSGTGGKNNNGRLVGSYGVNVWVLQDPECRIYVKWGGSRSDAQSRYFERYANLRGDVPLLGDAFRMDVWPYSEDVVPTARGKLKDPGDDLPHSKGKFMWRYCVDRHTMAVNIVCTGGNV